MVAPYHSVLLQDFHVQNLDIIFNECVGLITLRIGAEIDWYSLSTGRDAVLPEDKG